MYRRKAIDRVGTNRQVGRCRTNPTQKRNKYDRPFIAYNIVFYT